MEAKASDINKNNRLIAEFMGGKFQPELNAPWSFDVQPNEYLRKGARIMNLMYHEDWNWLMPVVEKIGNIVYPYYENGVTWQTDYSLSEVLQKIANKTSRTYLLNNKETIWRAVVEFIQWYNSYISKQQTK